MIAGSIYYTPHGRTAPASREAASWQPWPVVFVCFLFVYSIVRLLSRAAQLRRLLAAGLFGPPLPVDSLVVQVEDGRWVCAWIGTLTSEPWSFSSALATAVAFAGAGAAGMLSVFAIGQNDPE